MARLRQRRRVALTLTELLVVLAILGVLIALLLPAVQKVRESAATTQSSNNLHQIALTIQQCQEQYGVLPPGFGYFPGGPQDPTYHGGSSGHGFLFFHLLPFLEQSNLYQSTATPGNGQPPNSPGTLYDPDLSVAATPLKVYQDPLDPSLSSSGIIQNSQTAADNLAACGYAFNAQVFCQVDRAGNFVDWWSNPRLSTTFADGTANTILFTEKYSICGQPGGLYGGANAWAAPSQYENAAPVFSVSRFPSAGTFAGQIASTGPTTHFQVRPSPYASDNCQYWVPQTPRSGGILVGLADGSVRNVATSSQSSTWWAACTPASGETLGNDW